MRPIWVLLNTIAVFATGGAWLIVLIVWWLLSTADRRRSC